MTSTAGLVGAGLLAALVLALIAARAIRPQFRRVRFGIFVERERFDDDRSSADELEPDDDR